MHLAVLAMALSDHILRGLGKTRLPTYIILQLGHERGQLYLSVFIVPVHMLPIDFRLA